MSAPPTGPALRNAALLSNRLRLRGDSVGLHESGFEDHYQADTEVHRLRLLVSVSTFVDGGAASRRTSTGQCQS
jgi:hypothetical protein